jgi:hypothetical protein
MSYDTRRKLVIYRDIQLDLRVILRDAVQQEDFSEIRDAVLELIDETQEEMNQLHEKRPFDGLEEPEKSLLADLLEELPKDKEVLRQKALQLADLIRNKYQNIERLQLSNRKASAWSRWGAFGTFLFGMVSIVVAFYTLQHN